MRVSNLTDFTLELAGTPGTNRRQLFVTGTYGNSAKLMSSIFDISNRTVRALSVPGMTYSLSFQPLPTAITTKAASRGGNSLGLTGAEGNLFNLLLGISWDSVADDERIEQHAKALFQQSEDKARELGLYSKYVYLNYAAPWQDPFSGYGAAQKVRLQDVSRKYDPKGVFQKQVSGGFKLFD
jgi:FAD/FMN-containing dehydrogenase